MGYAVGCSGQLGTCTVGRWESLGTTTPKCPSPGRWELAQHLVWATLSCVGMSVRQGWEGGGNRNNNVQSRVGLANVVGVSKWEQCPNPKWRGKAGAGVRSVRPAAAVGPRKANGRYGNV